MLCHSSAISIYNAHASSRSTRFPFQGSQVCEKQPIHQRFSHRSIVWTHPLWQHDAWGGSSLHEAFSCRWAQRWKETHSRFLHSVGSNSQRRIRTFESFVDCMKSNWKTQTNKLFNVPEYSRCFPGWPWPRRGGVQHGQGCFHLPW